MMKKKFCLFIFCLIFLLFFYGTSSAWENYTGVSRIVYVSSVEPGNILVVNGSTYGKKEDTSVRFYGIGIPTEKQPFGKQAHEELQKILPPGQKIIITSVKSDENGVVTALVQLHDRSVNSRLIDNGLAWVDRTTCKAFFCRRWHIQEHLAIKNRKGLWSLNISTPPWQWGE